MFCLKNKKIIFLLHTLNKRPVQGHNNLKTVTADFLAVILKMEMSFGGFILVEFIRMYSNS